MNATLRGHLLAPLAVLIWGMTFIASKVLVGLLDPYWYIVLRFAIAWLALFCLSPRIRSILLAAGCKRHCHNGCQRDRGCFSAP